MIVVLIGASLIGLSLGILGSGGSILTVPVLIYGLGYSEKIAITSALVIVGFISASTALIGIKQKNISWPLIAHFGIPSMLGAYLGAWCSSYVLGSTQIMVLAFVMFGAAWRMLNSLTAQPTKEIHKSLTILLGLGVGVMTGFVGVGGGFLIVPALVLLGGISMNQAIFTSLIVITINSATGFIKYQAILHQHNQQLDWPTIALISVIGIAGSFIGQHYSAKLPQPQIKKVFALFLILMAVFILLNQY